MAMIVPTAMHQAPSTSAGRADGDRCPVVQHRHLLAFPCHWQVPAATEQAAYEAVAAMPEPPPWQYVGFPWATLIDGLCRNAATVAPLLAALKAMHQAPRPAGRRVTVAQHIHALQYVELFTASGVTDLFWSHATHQQPVHEGVRVHGFALYPAQAPVSRGDLSLVRPRRYLANFIGAYSAGLYLSQVRETIFNDAGHLPDVLIVKRSAWHFDRAVYQEQIKGVAAQPLQLSLEQAMAQEYIQGIIDSWFTLCPSGSGPNSIRIFESLTLMSIPIILTRSLKLPGPPDLWQKAALIEDDTAAGYHRALAQARALGTEQRLQMLQAGQALVKIVGPAGYAGLIQAGLDQ
jgi:hypothetical protein